jgi:hypothetical protein
MESVKRDAIYLSSSRYQETFIDLISDISTYLSEVRSIQAVYDEEKKWFPNSSKSQDKTAEANTAQRIFKTQVDLDKFYEEQKTQKAIDLVDIKRRIDDFIKVLEAQN